jgi:peptidoglycan/LPS O-acetylase OafA/YrhL
MYAFTQGINLVALYKLTPGCLDSLGIGALLAQARHSRLTEKTIALVMNRALLPIAVFISLCLWALVYFEINWSANIVLFDLSVAVIFCWFINSASVGFGGIAGRLMELRPLVYCGKISYGMYVYHQFAVPIYALVLAKFGIIFNQYGWTSFVLGTLLTIIISSLSWYILEQPFNNLKRYFDYQTKSSRRSESIVEPKVATSESRVAS